MKAKAGSASSETFVSLEAAVEHEMSLTKQRRENRERRREETSAAKRPRVMEASGNSRRQQDHDCDPRANAARASSSTRAPGGPPPECAAKRPAASSEHTLDAQAAQEDRAPTASDDDNQSQPPPPGGAAASSSGAAAQASDAGVIVGSMRFDSWDAAVKHWLSMQRQEQGAAGEAHSDDDGGGEEGRAYRERQEANVQMLFRSREGLPPHSTATCRRPIDSSIEHSQNDPLPTSFRRTDSVVKMDEAQLQHLEERLRKGVADSVMESIVRERDERVRSKTLTLRAGIAECSPRVCASRPGWNAIIKAFFPDKRSTLEQEQALLQETLVDYRSWLADQLGHGPRTIEAHSLGMARFMWVLSMETAPGEAELLGLRDRDLMTKLQKLAILSPDLEWTRGVWEALHFYIERHLDREGVHREVKEDLREVQKKSADYRRRWITKKEAVKKHYDRQARDQEQASLMRDTWGMQERRKVAVSAAKTLKYLSEKHSGNGLGDPKVGRAANSALATMIFLRTLPLRQGPWRNLTWAKFKERAHPRYFVVGCTEHKTGMSHGNRPYPVPKDVERAFLRYERIMGTQQDPNAMVFRGGRINPHTTITDLLHIFLERMPHQAAHEDLNVTVTLARKIINEMKWLPQVDPDNAAGQAHDEVTGQRTYEVIPVDELFEKQCKAAQKWVGEPAISDGELDLDEDDAVMLRAQLRDGRTAAAAQVELDDDEEDDDEPPRRLLVEEDEDAQPPPSPVE